MSWLDPGQCSSCKHCGMDMDMGPYCAEPSVLEKHTYGLNINYAIKDYCGQDLQLRVEKIEND